MGYLAVVGTVILSFCFALVGSALIIRGLLAGLAWMSGHPTRDGARTADRSGLPH